MITHTRPTNTRLGTAWGERRQFRPNSNKSSYVNELIEKILLLEEDTFERAIQRKQLAKTGTILFPQSHTSNVKRIGLKKNLCECGALTGILPV